MRSGATRVQPAPAAAALAAVLLLGGCAVGPNFHRPAAPAMPGYRPSEESRPVVSTAAAAAQQLAPAAAPYAQRIILGAPTAADWWSLFQSPQLDELIRRAIADNRDLAAAKATLAQAQELVAREWRLSARSLQHDGLLRAPAAGAQEEH